MKSQKEFPLYEKYAIVFPVTPKTIFAYDGEIYCDYNLTDDLMVHEKTHIKQQNKIGLEKWVDRYLTDNRFRLDMELEAYQKQLDSIKDRNHRFRIKQEALKTLSSELYGYIITYQDAQKLLR